MTQPVQLSSMSTASPLPPKPQNPYLTGALHGLVMLALLRLLASCATTGLETKTACEVFQPIYVSKNDRLTDDSAKEILRHNLLGAKLCGWKPAKKGTK